MIKCQECGRQTHEVPSARGATQKRFCSAACRNKWHLGKRHRAMAQARVLGRETQARISDAMLARLRQRALEEGLRVLDGGIVVASTEELGKCFELFDEVMTLRIEDL